MERQEEAEMPDKTIECVDCGAAFVFTEKDQKFFASKKYNDPKRCQPCRQAKKRRNEERESMGAGETGGG